jgi:hypothetical protein
VHAPLGGERLEHEEDEGALKDVVSLSRHGHLAELAIHNYLGIAYAPMLCMST